MSSQAELLWRGGTCPSSPSEAWMDRAKGVDEVANLGSPMTFDFKAGDVVLTTRVGALPRLLRLLVGAPVSHAAVMITPEFAIEARDDAWDLSESGGRVYIRSKSEIFEQLEVQRVVVRRPPVVDEDKLISFAVDIVECAPRFANAALAMAALFKLKTRVRRLPVALARHLSGQGHLTTDEARWIEAIADGTKTVVCTEVVYRALAASGTMVDLSEADMAEAMKLLPEARVTEEAACDKNSHRRFDELAANRAPEPDAPSLNGRSGSGLAMRSAANLRERIERRLGEEPNGDRADLVTPADLYRLDPLETVSEWERDSRGWIAA